MSRQRTTIDEHALVAERIALSPAGACERTALVSFALASYRGQLERILRDLAYPEAINVCRVARVAGDVNGHCQVNLVASPRVPTLEQDRAELTPLSGDLAREFEAIIAEWVPLLWPGLGALEPVELNVDRRDAVLRVCTPGHERYGVDPSGALLATTLSQHQRLARIGAAHRLAGMRAMQSHPIDPT